MTHRKSLKRRLACEPARITHGDRKGQPQLKRERSDAFTEARREAFFEALEETSNITASARVAGVSRPTVRNWCRKDPAFAERYVQALHAGYAELEMTMLGRARFGHIVTATRRTDPDSGDVVTETVNDYAPQDFPMLRWHSDAYRAEEQRQRDRAADLADEQGLDEYMAELRVKIAKRLGQHPAGGAGGAGGDGDDGNGDAAHGG